MQPFKVKSVDSNPSNFAPVRFEPESVSLSKRALEKSAPWKLLSERQLMRIVQPEKLARPNWQSLRVVCSMEEPEKSAPVRSASLKTDSSKRQLRSLQPLMSRCANVTPERSRPLRSASRKSPLSTGGK